MSWWKWSRTAATNANADPTINWAEGMPAPAVNDSARAEMAAAAKYFADQDGSLTTGGTSTAYTLNTNGDFSAGGGGSLSLLNGRSLTFVPNFTCGATVTLNVDSLGPKPLRTSPGVELQSGMLIQGTPYRAIYNNNDGAFYLQGFYSLPYTIPVGGIIPYVGNFAPSSNWIFPAGQAISRTTYATLFSLVSTSFGGGDGTTTFNVPDLRGRAIFGLDNMTGTAANRITVAGGNFNATTIGATGGAENHTLTQAEMPSHSHSITDPTHTHTFNDQIQGSPVTQLRVVDSTGGGSFGGTGSATSKLTQINSSATGITGTNAAGSGNAHPILPPTMVLPMILRVI